MELAPATCPSGGPSGGVRPESVSPHQEESSFGKRLRRLREAAGLTQEELAFQAGLTPNAVSGLERGKSRRPYPNTVRSLADALGLSEDERASLLAAVPRRDAPAPEISSPPLSRTPGSTLPNPATQLLGRERELELHGAFCQSEQYALPSPPTASSA